MGVERRIERLEAESGERELVVVYEQGDEWLDGKPTAEGSKRVDKAALRASDAVVLVVRYENPPPSEVKHGEAGE